MDEMGTVLMIINYFLFYLMMIVFINILNHHFSNIKGVRLFSLSFGITGLLLLITATIAGLGNNFTLTMALWIGSSFNGSIRSGMSSPLLFQSSIRKLRLRVRRKN